MSTGSQPRRSRRLGTATLKIAARCNSHCRFCTERPHYADHRAMEVPDRVKAELERLHAAGYEGVCFDGGEPTMSPVLELASRHARAVGFETVGMVTNGIRLADRERVERLRDAGLNAVCLSFHAPDHETSRALHGRDIYDLQVRALENLATTGAFTLTVQTVLVAQNARALPAIWNHCHGKVHGLGLLHCRWDWGWRSAPMPEFANLDDGAIVQQLETFHARSSELPFKIVHFPFCVLERDAGSRLEAWYPAFVDGQPPRTGDIVPPNVYLCRPCAYRHGCTFPLLPYLWQRRGRATLSRSLLRLPFDANAIRRCLLGPAFGR